MNKVDKMLIFLFTFAVEMNLTPDILRRKLVTFILVTISLAAFATLGDGGKKGATRQKGLLTDQLANRDFKTFTLKSGYNYRGSTIFSAHKEENRFIMLNTFITYEKGNSTYILPLKKKVLLDKINFRPLPPRP